MQLIFEQIRAGGDRNFGYMLGDRDAKQGVLIDPSYSPGRVRPTLSGSGTDRHARYQHPWTSGPHQRQCEGVGTHRGASGGVRGFIPVHA